MRPSVTGNSGPKFSAPGALDGWNCRRARFEESWNVMEKTSEYPEELVVYECRGDRPPRGEPSGEGFLGLWPEPPFYYLFFDGEAAPEALGWISRQEGWALRDVYRLGYAQWQDLAGGTFQVGPFAIQCDPSLGAPAAPDGIPIFLKAGVAFGTGVHPSTKGCLLSLAGLYERVRPDRVVDMGTGTGILAVACGRMGASTVLALDCLPLAIRETRQNIGANGLEKAVHAVVADSLNAVRGEADLLIMNMEWPCLTKVLREEEWNRFPRVLLSGFLESQWKTIEGLLASFPCRVASRLALDDWVTALVQNSNFM